MNNLQIALGRITRGIDWAKAFVIGTVRQILGKKANKVEEGEGGEGEPQKEAFELNHLDTGQDFQVTDMKSDCLVEGRPSGFYVDLDSEIRFTVPIAQGESDFEQLDDNDDSESESSDEDNKHDRHLKV